MIQAFVQFLTRQSFGAQPVPETAVDEAWALTLADVHYHFPDLEPQAVLSKVTSNSSELAIFLYRLGSTLRQLGLDALLPQVHGWMRSMCACEIYFNNSIGTGFYVVHGVGTVVGSRNVIGKGFVIHQGCTIGHRKNGQGAGSVIGDNVRMYANASLVGELTIGNNVTIGGHALVQENLPDGAVARHNQSAS